ncbi:hypothetical protein ACJX0J_035637, partial [Zea mays]
TKNRDMILMIQVINAGLMHSKFGRPKKIEAGTGWMEGQTREKGEHVAGRIGFHGTQKTNITATSTFCPNSYDDEGTHKTLFSRCLATPFLTIYFKRAFTFILCSLGLMEVVTTQVLGFTTNVDRSGLSRRIGYGMWQTIFRILYQSLQSAVSCMFLCVCYFLFFFFHYSTKEMGDPGGVTFLPVPVVVAGVADQVWSVDFEFLFSIDRNRYKIGLFGIEISPYNNKSLINERPFSGTCYYNMCGKKAVLLADRMFFLFGRP